MEQSAYVDARLVTQKTDDGIMEIGALVGKLYRLDIVSIQDQQWGHIDHPGVLLLELFEVEANSQTRIEIAASFVTAGGDARGVKCGL